MFWVYVLYSEFVDRYYVWSTSDLNDRLERHKSTKFRVPWQLVYQESFASRPEAYVREMRRITQLFASPSEANSCHNRLNADLHS